MSYNQIYPADILPNTNGAQFEVNWEAFAASLKSGFLGTGRPAGIAAGGIWSKDDAGTLSVQLFDGSTDVELARRADMEAADAARVTTASTNIQTSGGNAYRQIGDCLECWGTATTSAAGEVIVFYPAAFAAAPRVLVSARIPSLVTRNAAFDNSYGGGATTSFRAVGYNTETGAGTAVAFDWHAIGEAG